MNLLKPRSSGIKGNRADSDVKITGLEHAIRLSDQETEALIGLIVPSGGMPVPLEAGDID